ncbi:MAG: efflux RND transporter periplasmic adaptor subunit [Planctomycetota bacterium]
MIAATAIAAATLLAAPQPSTTEYPGVSRPADVRELAFGVRGTVAELLVKPGDRVTEGQLLVRLDDSVQAAQYELAKAQSDDDTNLRSTTLALQFRKDELDITLDSRTQGGATAQDVREAQFAFDRAQIDLAAAEAEMRIREITLAREAARLAEMSIAAPIAGDVVETQKDAGESVDELTTVITLVNTDNLRIDVTVPPSTASTMNVGDPATVVWQDIEADPVTEGQIIFIPATGDPSVREVAIRIEIPNPDRLPSGLHGWVSFPPPADADRP